MAEDRLIPVVRPGTSDKQNRRIGGSGAGKRQGARNLGARFLVFDDHLFFGIGVEAGQALAAFSSKADAQSASRPGEKIGHVV